MVLRLQFLHKQQMGQSQAPPCRLPFQLLGCRCWGTEPQVTIISRKKPGNWVCSFKLNEPSARMQNQGTLELWNQNLWTLLLQFFIEQIKKWRSRLSDGHRRRTKDSASGLGLLLGGSNSSQSSELSFSVHNGENRCSKRNCFSILRALGMEQKWRDCGLGMT